MQETYLDQSINASTIQKGLLIIQAKDMSGSKLAGCSNIHMPSVLVETGFLTNKKEGAYLNSKREEQMSSAIAKAILI